MNDIEKKAAAMMDALYSELVWPDVQRYPARRVFPPFEALCRAIEQHEAFRQEVSDAVSAVVPLIETWVGNHDYVGQQTADPLRRFIIAKPDPLAEAWIEATGNTVGMEPLKEAIAKRGGKIVWENER